MRKLTSIFRRCPYGLERHESIVHVSENEHFAEPCAFPPILHRRNAILVMIKEVQFDCRQKSYKYIVSFQTIGWPKNRQTRRLYTYILSLMTCRKFLMNEQKVHASKIKFHARIAYRSSMCANEYVFVSEQTRLTM